MGSDDEKEKMVGNEEVSDEEGESSNEEEEKKYSRGNINEIVSMLDDGYKSEEELNTRKLVTQMNRKKKKSGGFQSMGLSHNVFKGIIRKGYKVPTPIQRKCVPLIMNDKDVVAMARTGSGKTAAFLIPLFEKLQQRQSDVGARALLLSPTRELALQTLKFVKDLGKYTTLKTACILGGDKMDDQFSAIHENPDIIIATPGRLMHILVEMEFRLKCVQYVVFDEADRLFELGFQEHLHEILRRLPEDRQTLLFSATLPKQLVEFAKAGLNDPTLVRLDVDSKLSDQLKLRFLHLRMEDKLPTLIHLLRDVFTDSEQTVVFVATKHHVEYIKDVLQLCGMSVSYVYSSLDQTARKINIAKFRNRKTMILLVTDVAARGLDIPMLDNVVNYSFPSKSKLFVHRVGRVARAGRTGSAYSLVSFDELAFVIDLHLFLGKPMNFAKAGMKYQEWDNVYGCVPQFIIDEEVATMKSICNSADLTEKKKVSENAYKQYLRSRPPAANESVKRSKEILVTTKIGFHPTYDKYMDSSDNARLLLLSGVRDYKPTSTIFEIGATVKSTCAVVMKKTRKRNNRFIEKYQDKLKTKIEQNKLQSVEIFPKSSTEEIIADDVLTEVFDKVVKPTSSFNKEFVTKKKGKRKIRRNNIKDDDFYIEYRPKDHHSESGLSILSSQTSFSKQAENSALDLIGDEDKQLRQQKTQKKVWDRKRKRFVNAQDVGHVNAKKKIRTESGAVISSTYKKNIYADWKRKSKFDEKDQESRTQQLNNDWRGGSKKIDVRNKLKVGKQVKSELKRPEQIARARKLKEKKLKRKQKGQKRRK